MADRHDTTTYRGGNMLLRGEVMTLAWGNVTGPELCVLDWESWGRAPAGYDACTLLCTSLQHLPTAARVREIFQPVLDSHSGHVALLGAVCRYLALPNEPEEPLRTLGTDTITKLGEYVVHPGRS